MLNSSCKALEDPKQKVMRGFSKGFWRALQGSSGLVGKALEPKPSKDTSPDEPRLGSCKAYLASYLSLDFLTVLDAGPSDQLSDILLENVHGVCKSVLDTRIHF